MREKSDGRFFVYPVVSTAFSALVEIILVLSCLLVTYAWLVDQVYVHQNLPPRVRERETTESIVHEEIPYEDRDV